MSKFHGPRGDNAKTPGLTNLSPELKVSPGKKQNTKKDKGKKAVEA